MFKIIAISIAIIAIAAFAIISNYKGSEEVDASVLNVTIGELSIVGKAERLLKPDMVSINLGVTVLAENATDAVSNNAEIMNNIISKLEENGVSRDNIKTSYYNLYPIRSLKPDICLEAFPRECIDTIVGYRVVNSIMVTVGADEDVGRLIDIAVDAGATNVNSVNFFISRDLINKVKDELMEDAILDAKRRAEIILKPLNMSIVGVKSINVEEQARFGDVLFAEEAKTPILPSEQVISMSVRVTFLIG